MKRSNKNSNYNETGVSGPSKIAKNDVSLWTQDEVNNFLIANGLERFIPSFSTMNVAGSDLLCMTEDQIKEIDDIAIDESNKAELWKNVKRLQRKCSEEEKHIIRKVFQDAIHGSIELHPLLVAIIDTPQFQRLRNLYQLGGCYCVYTGAVHKRFEHSLGVCHLAGQLLRKLQAKQPELDIQERDILCVEAAGLCHDLGHGPFSHSFDGRFIPSARHGSTWRHEDSSVEMFDYIVESYSHVREAFEKYGLNKSDIIFIKEQIQGVPDGTTCHGRPREKAFLYEIVANKKNGIDVDKWDYFERDCHYLGIRNPFDHNRLMNFVRVLEVRGQQQICMRDKEAETLYDMFSVRRTLHKHAYQHRVCIAVELMICDAFLKADKHLVFTNTKGEKRTLSQSIDDPETFSKVSDHVYYQILCSTDPNLQEARKILQRLELRDLYKSVGETRPKQGTSLQKSDLQRIANEIANSLSEEKLEGSKPLNANDLCLNIVKLDYGMGSENPIENVWFYMKDKPDIPIRQRKDDISVMLPDKFCEQILVLYCKKSDPQSMEVAAKCFSAWCDSNGIARPCPQYQLNMTQS